MEMPSTAPTCRTCPLSVESPQILKIQISSLSNWNLLNQKQTRAKLHVWKTEFPLSAAVASITIALPAQLCPSVCFQNLFSAFLTCLLRTRLLSFLTGRPHFQRKSSTDALSLKLSEHVFTYSLKMIRSRFQRETHQTVLRSGLRDPLDTPVHPVDHLLDPAA